MTPTSSLARSFALAVALAAPSAVAETAEPPALDPLAIDLLTNAADFLAAQQNLSMNWFVSYDVVVDGREKITYLRSGSNILSRETGFYSYLEREDSTREFFYDGETFAISLPEQNAYVSETFEGGFEALVRTLRDEYDVILPIWEILTPKMRDELLEGVEAAAYLGTTMFAGQEVHHLAFAEYEQDWQIWISTAPEKPVPLMFVGTNPYEQGWPQYRAYMVDWNFAPEVDDGQFTFTPEDEDERISWPRVVDALEAEREESPQGSKSPSPASETKN